jgi:hypothetical protein
MPTIDGDKTIEGKLGTEACVAAEKRYSDDPANKGKPVPQVRKIKSRDVLFSNPGGFNETNKPGRQVEGEEWKVIIYAIEANNPGWKYHGMGPNSCCCCW